MKWTTPGIKGLINQSVKTMIKELETCSTWEKMSPIKGSESECSLKCCGITHDHLHLNTKIIAGFGSAQILFDGKCLYSEPSSIDFEEAPTLKTFEDIAKRYPHHDWRYNLFLPLRGAEYQRQDGLWVLISKNIGFA